MKFTDKIIVYLFALILILFKGVTFGFVTGGDLILIVVFIVTALALQRKLNK